MELTAGDTLTTQIPWREKAAFFWAHIGNVSVMSTINTFLLIFYTDVVGLNPAAIGTLFLISRVLDGFTDPLMGYFVDHLPHTRWGRFRPYLVVGAFLCAINFTVLWLGPLYAESGKIVIAYVSYLIIGITFDMMDIPLGAILPTMTADAQERNSLSAYKGMAYLLGFTVLSAGLLPLINLFESAEQGWTVTVIALAAVILGFTLVPLRNIQERITPEDDERYTFRQMFKLMFDNRPLVVILIATILVNIGVGLSSGAAIFYYTYNLGNELYFSWSSVVTLPGILLGFWLFVQYGHQYPKRALMLGFVLLSAFGVGIRMVIPYSAVGLVMVSVFFASIGSGALLPLIFSMIADVVDYTEIKHGYRAEGAVVSIQTFTQKTGLGIGGSIPGYILAASGYVPNGIQPESALFGILLATVTVPALAFLFAGLTFLYYPLDLGLNQAKSA